MKAIAKLVVMLILSGATCHRPHAAAITPSPALKVGDLTPYPWSETNEHVRIPKALLPHLDIKPTEFISWNGPDPNWKIAEQFSKIYRLTPAQTEALGSHLTKARHAMRFAEGRHLIPIDGPVPSGGYRAPRGLVVVEEFKCKLTNYQDELTKIERNLRLEILDTLGTERSEQFWGLSDGLVWTLQKFLRDGAFTGEFFQSQTFRLIEFQGALSVDLVVASSGSSHGGPHFEWEDQFAPDALKPVLKRWRASIVEYAATNKPPVVVNPDAPKHAGTIATTKRDLKEGSKSVNSPGPWDEAAAFVDLPKNLIPSLGVPGLSDDDTLSPEAVVLFGLTTEETKSVETLFIEFQQRFEQLEKANLTRPNGAENHFVLRPFPGATTELQDEWKKQLGKVIGQSRAEFLDKSIRTPLHYGFDFRRFREGRPWTKPRHVSGWPTWLNRGTKEVQFDITFQGGPKGKVSINYKIIDDNPQGASEGSMGGPGMTVPEDWKHLFTAEMFTPDIPRGPKEL